MITKIIDSSSEFTGVWRITTEDGSVLDIYENEPKIGTKFVYEINNESTSTSTTYTTMNGVVYNIDPKFVWISCGGLLSMIPRAHIPITPMQGSQLSVSYVLG